MKDAPGVASSRKEVWLETLELALLRKLLVLGLPGTGDRTADAALSIPAVVLTCARDGKNAAKTSSVSLV